MLVWIFPNSPRGAPYTWYGCPMGETFERFSISPPCAETSSRTRLKSVPLFFALLVVVIGVLGRPRGIGGRRGLRPGGWLRAWGPSTARCIRCRWRRRRGLLRRLGRTRWLGGNRGPRSLARETFGEEERSRKRKEQARVGFRRCC